MVVVVVGGRMGRVEEVLVWVGIMGRVSRGSLLTGEEEGVNREG